MPAGLWPTGRLQVCSLGLVSQVSLYCFAASFFFSRVSLAFFDSLLLLFLMVICPMCFLSFLVISSSSSSKFFGLFSFIVFFHVVVEVCPVLVRVSIYLHDTMSHAIARISSCGCMLRIHVVAC